MRELEPNILLNVSSRLGREELLTPPSPHPTKRGQTNAEDFSSAWFLHCTTKHWYGFCGRLNGSTHEPQYLDLLWLGLTIDGPFSCDRPQVGWLREARRRDRQQRGSRSGGRGGAGKRSRPLASLRPTLPTLLRRRADTSPQVRKSTARHTVLVAASAVHCQPARQSGRKQIHGVNRRALN